MQPMLPHSKLSQMKHKPRALWAAAALVLGVFILAGPLLVRHDAPRKADAIIVIGGDHKPERAQLAAALYRGGYAPVIILSAGTRVLEGTELVAEAEVMRRQALACGLPKEVLLIEYASRSTLENARYTRSMCLERDWRSVLLVTSTFHSKRAARIFRDVYREDIVAWVQPAPPGACTACWWFQPDQCRVVLYEYYNWGRYLLEQQTRR